MPIGGMCVRQKCAIGGSGSTYIYGHIDRHFKEGMNVDEIKQFVVDCKCMKPVIFLFYYFKIFLYFGLASLILIGLVLVNMTK